MKKKVLSIFAAVNLVLFGITLFSCAADGSDSSNDSESGGGGGKARIHKFIVL